MSKRSGSEESSVSLPFYCAIPGNFHAFSSRFGIEFPLIQSGMGGIAGPELAAAVAEVGAGGVLGLYRLPGPRIEELLLRTRELTERPFGVNLIPELMTSKRLAEQIDTVLHFSDSSVFFSFFGIPDEIHCKKLLRERRPFFIMIGDAKQIARVELLQADGVVLQGMEAGGHLLGSLATKKLLMKAIESVCDLPMLVSGGIDSGRTFADLAFLGAAGCLCGTLFVATQESLAHRLYKLRLVDSSEGDTTVTNLFDVGWPDRRHRVLQNALTANGAKRRSKRFIASLDFCGRSYPVSRYSATVPTAGMRGKIEEMAMYCGTSVNGVHEVLTAGTLVRTFISEFEQRWLEISEVSQ